jgi:tripartite ATP-independent transporter DctM subunit|tara:strand:- start:2942 stop:4246 length:1305 start_codon:yes stop_codon:yes gene_type:complete
MTEATIGILGILGMFVLLFLRTPVGIALMASGFVGIWVLSGPRAATATLASEAFGATSNYALTVIPMFVLMGNAASAAGFSRRLYEAAFAWLGGLRGGLASATILGCAAFAAVSGSSVATAVTIGRVSLPEMRRAGYSDGLATGSIAAGGTLGILIPPSAGFVIYAILTEESVGRLFMAGILPGILLTVLFILTIWLISYFNPEASPQNNEVEAGDKLGSLLRAAPLLGVIVMSIGGIYGGIFTPVEAAGVGAGLVIAMGFFGGKFTASSFKTVLLDTVRTTAMLYLIVIGAHVFGPFLSLSHIPTLLGEGLAQLNMGVYGTLIVILLAYVVLGMFLDGLAMLVITLPIVYPVIVALGFDPIWFGVIAVIVIEMGMITPPVGINVFVVKGVAPDIPMGTIFRGVFPFWVAMAVCLIILILLPQIALFIPNSMFG